MISDYKAYVYQNNDRRKLYWIIDLYLSKKMSAWSFCNEFHYCYGLENIELTPEEDEAFNKLFLVSSRFSPYKEEHIKNPGMFSSEEELRNEILEAKKKLKKQFEEFEEEIREKELYQI